MGKYTIQCNFNASYTTEVDAKDEGEARRTRKRMRPHLSLLEKKLGLNIEIEDIMF